MEDSEKRAQIHGVNQLVTLVDHFKNARDELRPVCDAFLKAKAAHPKDFQAIFFELKDHMAMIQKSCRVADELDALVDKYVARKQQVDTALERCRMAAKRQLGELRLRIKAVEIDS